jgi:hypothetical protein
MTQQVAELYTALRKAGVDDDTARAAAKSVIAIEDKEQLATKADLIDLRRNMAEMKASIIQWNLIAIGFVTALFSGLVTLLKFKP